MFNGVVASRPGPALTALALGDSPQLWAQLGFTVEHAAVNVDGVALSLDGPDPGIGGWSLDEVQSLELQHVPVPTIAAAVTDRVAHANGIIGIDHVVLMVGDLTATRRDLAALGLEIRRERPVELAGRSVVQMFAWVGPALLEVVGPREPSTELAHLWGITFVAPDLDVTPVNLGSMAGPARPAVQQGRQIVSLDTRAAGGTVRLAVMSPHLM